MSEAENKFQWETTYRGPLWTGVFWLVWSAAGLFYFLLSGEKGHEFYQIVYFLSGVMAIMALNNRHYGTNHRIAFAQDHLVLPKPLNIWHWGEFHLPYNLIHEITVKEVSLSQKILMDIEIKGDEFTYTIDTKKLPENEEKNILFWLQKQTGLTAQRLVIPISSEAMTHGKLETWQKRLLLMALFVSLWALAALALSEGYQGMIGGALIFLFSFGFIACLCYFLAKRVGGPKDGVKKWQRRFLLFYITFYGAIAMGFSMVFLNGVLDNSIARSYTFKVTTLSFEDEAKGHCVEAMVPNNMLPVAADEQGPVRALILLCDKSFKNLVPGDTLQVFAKRGALLTPWITRVERAPQDLQEKASTTLRLPASQDTGELTK